MEISLLGNLVALGEVVKAVNTEAARTGAPQ